MAAFNAIYFVLASRKDQIPTGLTGDLHPRRDA